MILSIITTATIVVALLFLTHRVRLLPWVLLTAVNGYYAVSYGLDGSWGWASFSGVAAAACLFSTVRDARGFTAR